MKLLGIALLASLVSLFVAYLEDPQGVREALINIIPALYSIYEYFKGFSV